MNLPVVFPVNFWRFAKHLFLEYRSFFEIQRVNQTLNDLFLEYAFINHDDNDDELFLWDD